MTGCTIAQYLDSEAAPPLVVYVLTSLAYCSCMLIDLNISDGCLWYFRTRYACPIQIFGARLLTPYFVFSMFSSQGCHLLLSLRKIAARRQRLDMSEIFSADIPLVHASSSGATDSSSLGVEIRRLPSRLSSASRVRPSVQVNVEAIELVPRHLSPIPATPSPSAEGSQGETPDFDYTRNWDIVQPLSSYDDRTEHRRSRGGRSEDRDGGLLSLQRWNP